MGDATCSDSSCPKPARTRGWCKRHYEQKRRHGLIEVRPRDPQARFWAKVDGSGACWEWLAAVDSSGYGTFKAGEGYGTPSAHRYAWTILVGPVPDGLELDHLCWNRRCVCPEHLEPVTHAENVRRGKQGKRRVFCLRGHSLAEHGYDSNPSRCRTCTRLLNNAGSARRRPPRPAKIVKPTKPPWPPTHCRNGHEFSDENTYVQTRNGLRSRQCRACKRVNQRRYKANLKGVHDDRCSTAPPGGASAAA